MSTDAKRTANAKHLAKLEEIRVRVYKGKKSSIKAAADRAGESLNAYIIKAVEERMKREAE